MLAQRNLFDSGSEKNTRILKPWWNELNDYLVTLLLAVPVFVGGMEFALGKFTCLPVVDCSFSKNGTLLSEIIYRNTCSVFYSSRKSTDANGKTTTVITGLKNLPEYDYVNSECSNNAVDPFHSYFSLILFGQAFILFVVNNLWLKFPSTASFVNSFYALVAECYNLPIPGARFAKFSVAQNNQQNPKQVEEQQSLLVTSSGILSDNQHEISIGVDLQTAVVAKALFEKIRRFNGYVKASQQIQRLYLIQALSQATLTVIFFVINIWHNGDLKGTVDCSIDAYVPVVYHNFTCSHNLAAVFKIGLVLFLIPLSLMCIFCVISVRWAIPKVNFGKRNLEYCFENALKNWEMPSDLLPAEADMGFLLHLLHANNELYAVQFAMCMSKKQYKKLKTVILDNEWPMEKLEKCVSENPGYRTRSISLTGLGGIPNALFQFGHKFYEGLCLLKLHRCGPLQADDLREFSMFYGLKELEIVNCGLTGKIPEGLFKLKTLKYLNLQNNSISHIQDGIKNLKKLNILVISSNKLETIDESIATIPLSKIDVSNNPNIQLSAIKNVLACQYLTNFFVSVIEYDKILTELNGQEAEKFKRVCRGEDEVNAYEI